MLLPGIAVAQTEVELEDELRDAGRDLARVQAEEAEAALASYCGTAAFTADSRDRPLVGALVLERTRTSYPALVRPLLDVVSARKRPARAAAHSAT